MKTNNNIPYTVSARQVVFGEDIAITATFKGAPEVYSGPLGGLAAWIKAKRVSGGVVSCTTDEGRHGLYPCLRALTPELAKGISLLRGYKVEEGDGATYFSRLDAIKDYRALALAGFELPEGCLAWGVTELAYANSKPKAPAFQAGQPSVEQQHAECPI